MSTASAEAFWEKRHGRRTSKKRQKEENPSLGQIDEVLARLCRSKLWRLKKHIGEINTNFCKKLVERSTVIELSQRFVLRCRLCFSVGLSDSKSEKKVVIADQIECGKNFFSDFGLWQDDGGKACYFIKH
jgi:hypothetical protein